MMFHINIIKPFVLDSDEIGKLTIEWAGSLMVDYDPEDFTLSDWDGTCFTGYWPFKMQGKDYQLTADIIPCFRNEGDAPKVEVLYSIQDLSKSCYDKDRQGEGEVVFDNDASQDDGEYPSKEEMEDWTRRPCYVCREEVSCGNFDNEGKFYCEDHYEGSEDE
jgi:hypothetical protein